MATGGATAKSIRALFDLPRYDLVLVERWAGWGRLTLVPKNTRFRCPRCHVTVGMDNHVGGVRSETSTSVSATSNYACKYTAFSVSHATGQSCPFRSRDSMLDAQDGWKRTCSA
jgi:hypothetical protein